MLEMSLFQPAGIYLLKVKNRNTRTMCEICSKLTKRYQNDARRRSGISLLSLNIFLTLF